MRLSSVESQLGVLGTLAAVAVQLSAMGMSIVSSMMSNMRQLGSAAAHHVQLVNPCMNLVRW